MLSNRLWRSHRKAFLSALSRGLAAAVIFLFCSLLSANAHPDISGSYVDQNGTIYQVEQDDLYVEGSINGRKVFDGELGQNGFNSHRWFLRGKFKDPIENWDIDSSCAGPQAYFNADIVLEVLDGKGKKPGFENVIAGNIFRGSLRRDFMGNCPLLANRGEMLIFKPVRITDDFCVDAGEYDEWESDLKAAAMDFFLRENFIVDEIVGLISLNDHLLGMAISANLDMLKDLDIDLRDLSFDGAEYALIDEDSLRVEHIGRLRFPFDSLEFQDDLNHADWALGSGCIDFRCAA